MVAGYEGFPDRFHLEQPIPGDQYQAGSADLGRRGSRVSPSGSRKGAEDDSAGELEPHVRQVGR